MVHLTLAIGQFFALFLMQITRSVGMIFCSAIVGLCLMALCALAGVWIGKRL